MDLETLAINVGDLEGERFMEPEPQAIDGGEVDLVVQGGGRREESLDLLHTEDGGETVGGLRTQEREGVPVTLEDVLIEEADTTIAEAHGRGGEVVDVFAVQEVPLQLLFRDAVG
jgi:Mg2+/Co2+ transporter CorC